MKRFLRISSLVLTLTVLLCLPFACKRGGGESSSSGASTTGLQLNKTELQTLIGDENLLTVKNENVAAEDVVWTSENTAVATVSEEGLVESVSVGTTNIKAVCGEYEGVCSVTVTLGNQLPQLVIENERSEYRIGKNEEGFPFELYVLFNGKKFYDADIVCTSFNDEVVTFDATEQGKLLVEDVGSTSVAFSATWRGMSDKEIVSLYKLVEVTVVEEIYFYVNGLQYDELKLYTVGEFEGESYPNQMAFIPTVDFSGTISSNVNYLLPENILTKEGDVIRATGYGTGKIILSYTDASSREYQSSINVTVTRPEATYQREIDYFSTFTGTFKDAENGYEDTTIAKVLFGTDDVENMTAYYDGVALEVENGKIFGMPNDYTDSYEAWLRVETDKVVYNVPVNVYGLVVQSKEDLQLFALKFLRSDNPLTPGVDETQVTCIDGYCVLLNDIDATGVTIEHEIFDVTYSYVNSKNETVQTTISMARYNSSVQKNAETGNYGGTPDGLDAFGFIGRFNGNGYTISNLNTSVAANKTGGGLFGYLFGNAIVENVGFTNLNISNSSGLAYAAFNPTPRYAAVDVKGLRTANTAFKDIYIELSEDTVNPKGALINAPWTPMGLIRFENIIIDATAVDLQTATTGGIITNSAAMFHENNMKANPHRFESENVYVISGSPAYFNASVSVYGENEANGNETDTLLDNGVYSSKFYRYDTFDGMKADGNDYTSFVSSSWEIIDYPVFKTASGVYAYYLGEPVLDGVIKVNSSVTGKPLSLATLSGETVQAEEFIYDSTKLVVDENGNIRLAQEATEIAEYELSVRYTHKGEDGEILLKVMATPAVLEVSKAVTMSAYDGEFVLSDYVMLPKKIQAVTQVIGGNSYSLTVDGNGNIKGAMVRTASDYSDVQTSELIVTTLDMVYRFTNVKIYSHIITRADDLKVFTHSQATGRITGYYILGGNINANGATVSHDGAVFSASSFDTAHAFQGVFDGRGYCIYNFRPGIGGLLGSVYSDTEANGGRTVIKNVAFINVLSEKGKDFTIFGKFMESAGTNLTEVKNVHVEIANTYLSDYNPTSNYKGLFHTNSSKELNTFTFTNIYILIHNEEYTDTAALGHGSLLTRDNVGVGSKANLQTRSARFENVITVTKMNPCIYRQFVGDSLTQTFDTQHMYFIYAANDAGKQGMRCNWLAEGEQYCHNPVAENGAAGSYLYNNVYRYDTADEVAEEQLQKLVASGYWSMADGALKWTKVPKQVEITAPEMNFDEEWLNA